MESNGKDVIDKLHAKVGGAADTAKPQQSQVPPFSGVPGGGGGWFPPLPHFIGFGPRPPSGQDEQFSQALDEKHLTNMLECAMGFVGMCNQVTRDGFVCEGNSMTGVEYTPMKGVMMKEQHRAFSSACAFIEAVFAYERDAIVEDYDDEFELTDEGKQIS